MPFHGWEIPVLSCGFVRCVLFVVVGRDGGAMSFVGGVGQYGGDEDC